MEGSGYEEVCDSDCFGTHFWDLKVQRKDELIIIDGESYWVGDENKRRDREFRGFDGRKFTIQKFGEEPFETTNLWANGTVPEEYRSRLPDNAVFVR